MMSCSTGTGRRLRGTYRSAALRRAFKVRVDPGVSQMMARASDSQPSIRRPAKRRARSTKSPRAKQRALAILDSRVTSEQRALGVSQVMARVSSVLVNKRNARLLATSGTSRRGLQPCRRRSSMNPIAQTAATWPARRLWAGNPITSDHGVGAFGATAYRRC